jgi:hypothetical protein
MVEFIVNIAPEKEALVKELIGHLGGSVMDTEKKRRLKKSKVGKRPRHRQGRID